MSRIGKKPVVVPAGVEVTVDANNVVTVKGPKGQLQEQISKLIKVEVAEGVVNVSRDSDQREYRSQHGLARTLINNMVTGVTAGFEKKMQLVGVGYKAEKKVHKLHFVQSCIKTVVNVKEQMIIRIISEFGVTPHKGAELRHDIFAIHRPFSA